MKRKFRTLFLIVERKGNNRTAFTKQQIAMAKTIPGTIKVDGEYFPCSDDNKHSKNKA